MPQPARRTQAPENSGVSTRALLAACALLVAAWARAADEQTVHPLLELARARLEKQESDDLPSPGTDGVRAAERALEQAHVPPDADCARSLGAPRFALLYGRLGAERLEAGDAAGAVPAYARGLACQPRNVAMHVTLAQALL